MGFTQSQAISFEFQSKIPLTKNTEGVWSNTLKLDVQETSSAGVTKLLKGQETTWEFKKNSSGLAALRTSQFLRTNSLEKVSSSGGTVISVGSQATILQPDSYEFLELNNKQAVLTLKHDIYQGAAAPVVATGKYSNKGGSATITNSISNPTKKILEAKYAKSYVKRPLPFIPLKP